MRSSNTSPSFPVYDQVEYFVSTSWEFFPHLAAIAPCQHRRQRHSIMSSGFPASGNNQPETFRSSNDTEPSYNGDIIYDYSEIEEPSYSGSYGQLAQYPSSSLVAFDVINTDPVSWDQIDPSSNLTHDIDRHLGSIPPIIPQSAH